MPQLDFSRPRAQSVKDLLTHQFPPQSYWWGPRILPKSATMLISGPSGIGKSLLTVSLIKSLIMGTPVFGQASWDVPEPASVLYIDQEVSPEGLQERIVKSFSPDEQEATDRFYFISGHPEISLSTPSGIQILQDEIIRHQPSVLILDPISNLHTYEENDSTQIGRLFGVIEALKKLGHPWGMSVVIIHHNSKPPRESDTYDPLSARNIRGSSKFESMADAILMITLGPSLNKPYHAWKLKCRLDKLRHTGKLPDFWLKLNEDNDFRVTFDRFDGDVTFAGGVKRFTAPAAKPVDDNPVTPEPSKGPLPDYGKITSSTTIGAVKTYGGTTNAS
jgi:hypothetical protein